MSQELQRTFHQVTLGEQKQAGQSPEAQERQPLANRAGGSKGTGADVRQSSQPPVAQAWCHRSGHTPQGASLLHSLTGLFKPGWGCHSCPQCPQLGTASTTLCTCSQSSPKGLPTFVLSPVCSATFWNNRLQTFGLIFLSPSLMGRKVTFFSLDYIFSEE